MSQTIKWDLRNNPDQKNPNFFLDIIDPESVIHQKA